MMKCPFLVLFSFLLCISCIAKDNTGKLLSLVRLSPENITRERIVSLLGKPGKVEESRKSIRWYYLSADSKLMLQWNKNEGHAEKFSFNCSAVNTCLFDNKMECKLVEGKMNIDQAVTLLGTPRDMVVKSGKQILYYNYQHSVLRLFFRNRTLVDYAFVENSKASL